jgi:rRNA processing protein Gar1
MRSRGPVDTIAHAFCSRPSLADQKTLESQSWDFGNLISDVFGPVFSVFDACRPQRHRTTCPDPDAIPWPGGHYRSCVLQPPKPCRPKNPRIPVLGFWKSDFRRVWCRVWRTRRVQATATPDDVSGPRCDPVAPVDTIAQALCSRQGLAERKTLESQDCDFGNLISDVFGPVFSVFDACRPQRHRTTCPDPDAIPWPGGHYRSCVLQPPKPCRPKNPRIPVLGFWTSDFRRVWCRVWRTRRVQATATPDDVSGQRCDPVARWTRSPKRSAAAQALPTEKP